MNKFEAILQVYADWAHELLHTEIETQFGASFGCYPEPDLSDSLIEIGMTMAAEHTADLPNWFRDEYGVDITEVDITTLCFLHEVGHLATAAFLTAEERDTQAAGRNNPNITFDEYRHLPGEYAADYWAAEYLKNTMSYLYWQRKLRAAYAAVTEADLISYAKGELND